MRDLLIKLLRLVRLAPPAVGNAPLPAVPSAPDWLPQHERVWRGFLSSDCGQVLWARLRAVEAFNALRAVQDAISSGHSAGRAAGFQDCRLYLESLSRTSLARPNNETDVQPIGGESELYERMSP